MANETETKVKKKREMPHVFAILILLAIVALIATWLVPSGAYDRVPLGETGRMIVDPSTFHFTDKTYLTPFAFLKTITDGLTGAALVSFSIMIIGGAWEVINKTGTIFGAVSNLGKKFTGREQLMFPILMAVFAFIAAIIGGAELQIVYLPAILPIVLMLGFDTMTAAACVLISAVTAFAVSVTNPFTVAIGQQITGIELYSGSWYRVILQIIFFIPGVWYVLRYAKKVKNDPSKSVVYEESAAYAKELEKEERDESKMASPGQRKAIGIVLIVLLLVMVFGIVKWGWYMNEINGFFLLAAVIAAVISRMPLNDACRAFAKGASDVVSAALVCGLSATIALILTNGGIIDVVIHALATVILALPKAVSLVGVFIAQELFNFLVNSGSGQFLITMPILAPLGDIAGLAPNALVLASQMGDGFTNIIFPTSGVLMACLAIAKIPYQKWVKFILPYVGIVTCEGIIALIVAQLINYM